LADESTDREPTRSIDVEVGVIDVPLVGSEPPGADVPDERPPTNWRRAIGIALVAGTVIGIGASVVRLTDDDSSATSTLPAEDLAAVITTPPTLTPLETLPPPDFDRSPPPQVIETPEVTLPTYAEVPDVELSELVGYDIGRAVELLDLDIARRSETHVEFGYGGLVMDVTIERDPVRDRYQIVIRTPSATQVAIVDIPTGTTYINPGTNNREEVLNADIIAGSTAADANEYFDRLLLGPLRPDTSSAPTTRGRGLVTIDGVGVARQFMTAIPGELIPEWQIYTFGPVFEFAEEDRPDTLEYSVYVTDDGRIAQVDGVAFVGRVPQLVSHRLTEIVEPVPIDIPPQTTPPPATAAPATTPPATAAPTTAATTTTPTTTSAAPPESEASSG